MHVLVYNLAGTKKNIYTDLYDLYPLKWLLSPGMGTLQIMYLQCGPVSPMFTLEHE